MWKMRNAGHPFRFAVALYFCDCRNFVTSRADGIEGCAPLRVTETAATAEAKRAASSGVLPASRLTARPALKAPPAAVESIAFTTKDGTISRRPSAVARKAPWAPILITTFLGPRSRRRLAQRAAVAGGKGSGGGRPPEKGGLLLLGGD